MGCCTYALKVPDNPSLPQRNIPSEEDLLHSSEKCLSEILFDLHKAPSMDMLLGDSGRPECSKKILKHFSDSSQNTSLSLFLSWVLVSDLSSNLKAAALVSILDKQILTFMDLYALVETLVELSSRTLPFLVYNMYDMNEYTFHYYVSSLAKSKRSFKDSVLNLLLGTEPSILSKDLAGKIASHDTLQSLLNSHLLRTKLWDIAENDKLKQKMKRKSMPSDLGMLEYLNTSFYSTRDSSNSIKTPLGAINESCSHDLKSKRISRVFLDYPLREIANK